MKIGIVLKDRCHEDALKCDIGEGGNYIEYLGWLLCIYGDKDFMQIGNYLIAKDQIKYIYKIND